MTGTYNSPTPDEPGHTLGGYSQQIVVHERYVLHSSPARAAGGGGPLCAGITTHACRYATGRPGRVKVGVVGIGGLGHGDKLAHAMGRMVAFTTSESKRSGKKAPGPMVVNSRNADEMVAHVKSFDFILNTVAAPHNLDDFTTLLKRDGTITLVGACDTA